MSARMAYVEVSPEARKLRLRREAAERAKERIARLAALRAGHPSATCACPEPTFDRTHWLGTAECATCHKPPT